MKRNATFYIVGSVLGTAIGALSCNGMDAVSEVGGSAAAGVGFSAVTGGPIPTGTGGNSADPPPLQEPNSSTLPDMLAVAGAAGMAGEGGASGHDDRPLTPAAPDGALLSGIWDDNLNFDWFSSLVQSGADDGQLSFESADYLAANARARETQAQRETLDVALLLDTTGSMGDELMYLQDKLGALWSSIDLDFPNAEQRWALVAYRDEGDNYVSRTFDFMAKRQELESLLLEQRAEGGGDRPEAAHRALSDMLALSWRQEDSNARLALWITDAPHHAEKADLVEQSLLAARQSEIHIYPIASTNVDAFTTHALRIAAQLTGGRYLFLVDETRTGTMTATALPCFYVTDLDAALLRIIGIEMQGRYQPPNPGNLLATYGAPVAGECSAIGGTALAY